MGQWILLRHRGFIGLRIDRGKRSETRQRRRIVVAGGWGGGLVFGDAFILVVNRRRRPFGNTVSVK